MSQDVNDGEAAQGESDDGSSPSKEAGLLSALQAERQGRQALAVEVAELKGKIDGLATKTPPREFTRAELQQQVDDGRMTPDESDRIIHDQMKQGIKTEVSRELSTEHQATARAVRIKDEIKLYTDFKPDILLEGTDARSLVNAEYQRQMSDFGKPDNIETELDALQTVYGPSGRLQASRNKETETFQDTGSDGGGETSESGGWPKEMSKGHKAYYQDQINKGIVADKKAAIEKWSYKPKHGRRSA